ncbi:hypothetical protein DPSP01_005365 [Paraphaeosphaeria sporulosa]
MLRPPLYAVCHGTVVPASRECRIFDFPLHLSDMLENSAPPKLWPEDRDDRVARGRVIQIRSTPPIVALQLLTVLRPEFNIQRLFYQFTSHMSLAGSYRFTAYEDSWSYTIKYYYLGHGKTSSYEGHESGILHAKTFGFYICGGTSSITLSSRF